jgi:hypothetical protein
VLDREGLDALDYAAERGQLPVLALLVRLVPVGPFLRTLLKPLLNVKDRVEIPLAGAAGAFAAARATQGQGRASPALGCRRRPCRCRQAAARAGGGRGPRLLNSKDPVQTPVEFLGAY